MAASGRSGRGNQEGPGVPETHETTSAPSTLIQRARASFGKNRIQERITVLYPFLAVFARYQPGLTRVLASFLFVWATPIVLLIVAWLAHVGNIKDEFAYLVTWIVLGVVVTVNVVLVSRHPPHGFQIRLPLSKHGAGDALPTPMETSAEPVMGGRAPSAAAGSAKSE